MEVGKVKAAAFTSYTPFLDTDALSGFRCISRPGGTLMARHQHLGVRDAEVGQSQFPRYGGGPHIMTTVFGQ